MDVTKLFELRMSLSCLHCSQNWRQRQYMVSNQIGLSGALINLSCSGADDDENPTQLTFLSAFRVRSSLQGQVYNYRNHITNMDLMTSVWIGFVLHISLGMLRPDKYILYNAIGGLV